MPPGSTGGVESLVDASNMDKAMSTGDLQHQIDALLSTETVQGFRMNLLITLASSCCSSPSNLRMFTNALTSCWEEQRYFGTAAVEWKTCIIQAAGTTKGAAKEATGSLVSLCLKASSWCTEIVSADLQGRISERELPAGGLSKIQIAALKLFTSVFQVIVDKYPPTEPLRSEEAFAPVIENLISSSFKLSKIVYLSSMKTSQRQPSDNESLRKGCHELLTLTSRLVYTFRRHLGSHSPGSTGMSICEKLDELKSPEIWQKQAISLRIVASSIRSLAELGDLSTKVGVNSLGLLNVSWKTVFALLQMEEGRDIVSSAVDITDILNSLLHHSVQALNVPIKTWFSSSNSGEKDARRLCIPIKFFFQMAEKIAFFYPQKAIMASKSIVLSVSKVLASLLLQYRDGLVPTAELQVLAELVIPSALDILHNLFSARNVEEEKKVQLLQLITCDNEDLWSSHAIADLDVEQEYSAVLDELFNDKPNGLGLLKAGRLALFVSLLQVSSQWNTTLLLELTLKLHWLLEAIPDQGVYVLLTQARLLPVWTADGKVTGNHQLMFTWILNSLQTFAGVAVKDDHAWTELQHFLYENVLNPCSISREVILNLFCFMIRRGDPDSAQKHVDILFSLLQDMASRKVDTSVLRRLARFLCVLLEESPDLDAGRVCASVFEQNPFSSESTAIVATVLLQEGYSFTVLRDCSRKAMMNRFLSSCITCLKGLVDNLKEGRSHSNLHSQKQALICLQLLLCESAFGGEEVEERQLQETLVIAQELLSETMQEVIRSPKCRKDDILSYALQLIPHILHLLDSSFIQNLLPRLNECCALISQNTPSKEIKQILPEFLANLSETAMTEEEENPAMRALWGLYHVVLKEKHWALVHMGLASFSHFATRTSCQELWRFVPEDATLALKTNSDNTTEDVFMNALKSFIEKEASQNCLAPSDEELELLRNEGAQLHKDRHEFGGKAGNGEVDEMDIDRLRREAADIELSFEVMRKDLELLRKRIPTWLVARCSGSHLRQIIRTRLAELQEEVCTLQQLEESI